MLVSGGSLVVTKRADILTWRGRTDQITGRALEILGGSMSYAAMYEKQPWVNAVVKKLAFAQARLPLKTYKRAAGGGRDDARDTPYGQLLRRPNRRLDPVSFWRWVSAMQDIYGEAFVGKVRDGGGRPVELVPLHPMWMSYDTNSEEWTVDDGKRRFKIARRDFIHFRYFSPNSARGLSPLEPLRSTLENEIGARTANSAMWIHGGRPSVVLSHPRTLSDASAARIAANWNDVHGGVENWGKAAVLEEGLTATVVPLNVEELQYIEARKLNREEVCGVYDMPPPAVHILDHATFSNITEQLRSVYRDTIAPRTGAWESTLDVELRDGRMGAGGEPDFPDDVYGEFLMDEVLRGDFEVRTSAWATRIQTGQSTAAEARAAENLPFIPGSDKLLINAALVAVEPDKDEAFDKSDLDKIEGLGQLIRAGFEPEPSAAALGLPPIPHTGLVPVTLTPPEEPQPVQANPIDLRSVMGRLSRAKSLNDVDPTAIAAHGSAILAELEAARTNGESLDQFKARLRALTEA